MRAPVPSTLSSEVVWADSLVAALLPKLEGVDLPDPVATAAWVIASMPLREGPWAELLGPVYTTETLRSRLGCSRQAVESRRKAGTLLAAQTSDGHWIYPASQFRSDGSVPVALVQAARVLRQATADPWTVLSWLASRRERDCSPIEVFVGGDPAATAKMVVAVQRTAARWAG